MVEELTQAEARRIALASQGLGVRRPLRAEAVHLRRVVDRLGFLQIDSVNVLVRAHYLPLFSRLGSYDRRLLDQLAWGAGRRRRLFEYWGHEASLLPVRDYGLWRWRMALADRGEGGWAQLRPYARERRDEAMAVLRRIREEGPLGASDLERGRPGWWSWSDAKTALEWLFAAGHVAARTRRGSFERVYDLAERVIPAAVLAEAAPDRAEAQRLLVERAAAALGVATAAELRDYWRLRPAHALAAVASLRDEGVLVPVAVRGWPAGSFRHRDAAAPRRPARRALLAPFDPLVADRGRARRLFGFDYRIEIYTPEAARRHGYYVLPFLLGDRLVARIDLKADRASRTLVAHRPHLEPHAPPDTEEALAEELGNLATWLDLDRVAGPGVGLPPAPVRRPRRGGGTAPDRAEPGPPAG